MKKTTEQIPIFSDSPHCKIIIGAVGINVSGNQRQGGEDHLLKKVLENHLKKNESAEIQKLIINILYSLYKKVIKNKKYKMKYKPLQIYEKGFFLIFWRFNGEASDKNFDHSFDQ